MNLSAPPIPEAARAEMRAQCLTALRELEQECRSTAPSPVTLRELAGCVARACPQEFVTLVPAILELTEGLAGLVRCEWRLRQYHTSCVRGEMRVQLCAACVALRVQLGGEIASPSLACGVGGGPGG